MSALEKQIQQASSRNTELLQILAETDYAVPTLNEQLRLIHNLDKELNKNHVILRQLNDQRESELKDHVRYRDSHFRRFLFKATGQKEKFAAQASKEEKEYFDILRRHHETTVLNESLKQQLQGARAAVAQLEPQAKIHQAAQQELDNLYNAIFGGETPHFPTEDALERESEMALQGYHNVRMRHEQEAQSVKLMTEATKRAKHAADLLASARTASRMDIMGNNMADIVERSALGQAEMAYREARHLAQLARYDDLPKVNINQGHVMHDILMDNIFSDMEFHEEIKRGQREMESFEWKLGQKLKMAQERKKAVQLQLTEAEKELELKRRRLQAERMRVFEQLTTHKR
ncbi:unnamed protein product [Clonostachys byssicola]|uniref:Uncharacterized protein n=1 Tax=Clonostachys byssicola TaxID=160290 RepID=A0A9N9Y287_9HYPO|nr:unnamed protein product [Clonostachys byssicola]